ncbi:hypothetical protein V1286_001238 [Bradyrhizobium algeriense]|uniref:Transposase n=1 Tax=Bradyrhizobium algeriense TaxID=634784 RepID=A0ABU8B5A4_9BRAD
MPVERPNIPDCICVGKHRAVAIQLELVEKRDHGKRADQVRPTPINEIEIPECEIIKAQNAAWHVIA